MEVLSLVNYYARNGYYRHVQTVCNEVLKKRANDPTLTFWKSFGMVKEGSAGEAVRELEGLLRRADGQPLPRWHYLLTGDREDVVRAGVSVAGRVVSETDAGPLEHHVVEWDDDDEEDAA